MSEEQTKWCLVIERVENGYVLIGNDLNTVIQDNELKETESATELLYSVLDYFNLRGSKHDEERVEIKVAKKGEDY